MTFPLTKTPSWSFGEILTSAQMNALQTYMTKAVDGVGGGTYSVTAPIVLSAASVNALVASTSGTGGSSSTAVTIGASGSSPALYCGGSFAAQFNGQIYADTNGGSPHQFVGATEIASGSTFKLKGTTQWPLVDARTVQYEQPIAMVAKNTSSRFALNTFFWQQTSVADAGTLWIPLYNIPRTGTLTSVTMECTGGAAHAGLPATMPTISVVEIQPDRTALTYGPTSDTSASVVAYEVAHQVTRSVSSALADSSSWYAVVTGEAGANSVANAFFLNRIYASVSIAQIVP